MRYQQRTAPPPGGEPDVFVMSDATVDRLGDCIAQDGWQLAALKSPPPVLFNHDRNQIVGNWVDMAVRDGKLTGRINWTNSKAWPMAQYIRDLVREGILRTVSVGFRSLQKKPLHERADATFGPFLFQKNELLECSLVSVPANKNALAIAKDLPRDLLAEIFAKPGNEYSASTSARHGKHAEPQPKSTGNPMNTIAARIQNAQTEYNALRESLKALSDKEDLSQDDAKQYEELPGRIDAAKKELEKHQRAERALVDGGDDGRGNGGGDHQPIIMPPAERAPQIQLPAVQKQDPPRFYAQPKKQLVTGDLMLRALSVMAKSQAVHEHDMGKTLRDLYGGDEMVGVVLRAAVNPANTTVATWAAELVSTENVGFLDRLIPASIYQQLAAKGARYTFGNAGVLKIPVRAATPTLAGNWVGEGAAKPVRRASFSTVSLTPTKLSVISTFTEEMATYGSPAIEGIIRQAMSDDTSIALDTYLIDNVASSATRPAGLLNGVTPITASAATPATAAMVADLKALVGALTTANGGRSVAIIMNPAQALSLGFAQTTTGDFLFTNQQEAGSKFGVSFIVSNTCPAGRVIAVDAEDFASATGDVPRFAVSTDATLHEEDTTPLAIGTVGSPATIAAPARSLFQTDAVAIRMSLYVSWAMRRTGMVQTIAAVIW